MTGREMAAKVVEALRADNPRESLSIMVVLGDALVQYVEATNNIREFGAVCTQPKTGTALENPYLPVQRSAGAIISKAKRVKIAGALAVLGWAMSDGGGLGKV